VQMLGEAQIIAKRMSLELRIFLRTRLMYSYVFVECRSSK
jgi:hypothetical protein